MLSPQGPQWSRHSVTRVRRHGDRPPSRKNRNILFLANMANMHIMCIVRNVWQKLDTTKRLMSSPKCRSVEVINNPARPGSNHREVNCINYK